MATITFAKLLEDIERTRDTILVDFDRLDNGTYASVDTESKIEKTRKDILDYENKVNAFLNIDIETAMTFKLPVEDPATGNVRLRTFPEAEIIRRRELYQDDLDSFADRFEMFVIKYALTANTSQAEVRRKRIALLYNQVPSVQKRNTKGLSPDMLQDILLKTVFKDSPDYVELFNDKKSFFNSLLSGSPAAKRIEKEINGYVVGFVPHSKEDIDFKRNTMKALDITMYSVQEALGFTNPFDNLSTSTTTTASALEAGKSMRVTYKYDEYGNEINPEKHAVISKVSVHDARPKYNVIYTNYGGESRMVAGKDFFPGDIIEICPVKIMEEKDLYSRNIRESVFPLDSKNRLFGLPLGHAICYRNDMDAKGLEGNIQYEYNENKGTITISATRRIKKGNELLFHAEESDFANELHPYDFRYNNDPIEISKVGMKN